MRTLGLRDIVGPIMVGPSSSHTAGALRIAAMTRALLDRPPADVTFTLYGSFSRTYRGHGTDRALVAGLLGLAADDLRIRDSFRLADEAGLTYRFEVDPRTKTRHPNTVDLRVTDVDGDMLEVRGESIGGGAARLVRVDGFNVDLTGEYSALIVYQCDKPGTLGFLATTLGEHDINIGSVLLFRNHRGGHAFNVLEVDNPVPQEVLDLIAADGRVSRVRLMPAADLAERDAEDTEVAGEESKDEALALGPAEAEACFRKVDFEDGAALLAYAESQGMTLGRAFLAREDLRLAMQGQGGHSSCAYLRRALGVMRESVRAPLSQTPQTMGGLIGGEARLLGGLLASGGAGVGGTGAAGPEGKVPGVSQTAGQAPDVYTCAAAYAMAVLETNASMGRIVAAPTAGAAGVVPGVLFALQEEQGLSDDALADALATAAAVGYIVTRNATVAGAEGGCQAEMGTASAMAAAAAVQLQGGSPRQALTAAAIALTNMLGLVCDPVGGLVEEPCQKRNASAAANALVSAQMALAGVASTAPFDETVDAMRRVGAVLPMELRETALGGIATCASCVARCTR